MMLALVFIAGGAVLLWKRLGHAEQREAIDIDAVIDAKYPNRGSSPLADFTDLADLAGMPTLGGLADLAAPDDTEPRHRRDVVIDLLAAEPRVTPSVAAFVADGFPPPVMN